MKNVRNDREVKGTDPCPLITVSGRAFCLDRTCHLHDNPGYPCKYPPAPDDAIPDFLVKWTVPEFREALKYGLWDSFIIWEDGEEEFRE